ncbi:hypothetical protein JCM10213_001863 [Rhodosporidiobolus nylandii]
MTDLASSASTAVSTRTPAEKPQGATTDEPACRICLEGGDDDGKKGRLFVPCACKGTARFVHKHCLNEERRRASASDKSRQCSTCGFGYVPTRAPKQLKRSVKYYAGAALMFLGMLCLLSYWSGWLLRRQSRRADRSVLQLEFNKLLYEDRGTSLLHPSWCFPCALDRREDFLREATSALGFLVGDCRSFNLRPIVVRLDPDAEAPEELRMGWLYASVDALSACGRRWDLEVDAQQPPLTVRIVVALFGSILNAASLVTTAAAVGFTILLLLKDRHLGDYPVATQQLMHRCFVGFALYCIDYGLSFKTLTWRYNGDTAVSPLFAVAVVLPRPLPHPSSSHGPPVSLVPSLTMDLLKPISACFCGLTSRLTTGGSKNAGGKARVCRICLADGVDSETGRLFSPCRCSGTNGSVHENCLRVWRQSAHDRKHWSSCGTCGFEYCYWRPRPGRVRRFVKRRPILATSLIYLVLSICAGFLATAWLRWHEEYLLRATAKALENPESATPTKRPGKSSWNATAIIDEMYYGELQLSGASLRLFASVAGASLGDCTWFKSPSLGSKVNFINGGFSYGDGGADFVTSASSYCRPYAEDLGALLARPVLHVARGVGVIGAVAVQPLSSLLLLFFLIVCRVVWRRRYSAELHCLASQLWGYRILLPRDLPSLTNGDLTGLLPRSHLYHFAYVTATIVYSFHVFRDLRKFYLKCTTKKARMLDFSETVEAKTAGKVKGA